MHTGCRRRRSRHRLRRADRRSGSTGPLWSSWRCEGPTVRPSRIRPRQSRWRERSQGRRRSRVFVTWISPRRVWGVAFLSLTLHTPAAGFISGAANRVTPSVKSSRHVSGEREYLCSCSRFTDGRSPVGRDAVEAKVKRVARFAGYGQERGVQSRQQRLHCGSLFTRQMFTCREPPQPRGQTIFTVDTRRIPYWTLPAGAMDIPALSGRSWTA